MDDGPTTNGRQTLDGDLLVASGVSKRFGGVQALSDVTMHARAGEVLALAGENGSGKSTLAKIVAGALAADAGELRFEGEERSFNRPRDALDTGIALVTQELTAAPNMSVAENVLLTRLRRITARVRPRELAREALPLLRTVGLHVDPTMPFAVLGPGDRELAEIAKALASQPRLLILDEVTTRLPDPERLFTLIDRLCADGLAVVFITHRLREIRRLAHRALVLRDGRVAGELARDQLSDERLSSMMVGRELSGYFHKPNPSRGKVLLELRGVVTDHADAPVSLDVREGEVVGLAGLVGSGRSELLETIAGGRPRRRGEVAVGGVAVPSGSINAAMRAGVSFVPEDRRRQGLVPGSSIRENIALSSLRALSVVDRRAERARASDAVARLRIRCPDVEAEVRTLSGGNQQKVVLARCLSSGPRVLLLDEPTSGVDVGAREEIYRIIGEMVAGGMAVLLSSSDMVEVLGLSDRVVVLHEGAVAGELPRAEATEERIALLSAGGAEVLDVA